MWEEWGEPDENKVERECVDGRVDAEECRRVGEKGRERESAESGAGRQQRLAHDARMKLFDELSAFGQKDSFGIEFNLLKPGSSSF